MWSMPTCVSWTAAMRWADLLRRSSGATRATRRTTRNRATAWWIGFVVAFVVAHFFLFCNVFRIARTLELIWAAIFVALTYCTIMLGVPDWSLTIGGCVLVTTTLIVIELRKPSYHGILWKRINPHLLQWWESRKES